MELSEEEKKAINELKSKREYFEYQPEGCNWRLSFDDEEVHTIIDVILNLIEKQQKEIEEVKKQNCEIVKELKPRLQIDDTEFIERNFISKDKIREKIELYNIELEHIKNGEEFENERPMYYWGKVALENLLEEN